MRDLLKGLNLTEEQLTAICNAHTEKLKNSYVPISRFTEINETLKTEQTKVKERDEQLSEIGKLDIDGLKDRIKTLEIENKKKDAEAKAALELERKRNLVKVSWLEDAEYKAMDIDYVLEKTNLIDVKIDEATGKIISGFKEQRDNLIKERPGLFENKQAKSEEKKKPEFKIVGTPPGDGSRGKDSNPEISFGAILGKNKAKKTPIKTTEQINPWKTAE